MLSIVNNSMELGERGKGKENDRASSITTSVKVEDIRTCTESC
jgi:hypothetical protein